MRSTEPRGAANTHGQGVATRSSALLSPLDWAVEPRRFTAFRTARSSGERSGENPAVQSVSDRSPERSAERCHHCGQSGDFDRLREGWITAREIGSRTH
jgi:hypothetical protein